MYFLLLLLFIVRTRLSNFYTHTHTPYKCRAFRKTGLREIFFCTCSRLPLWYRDERGKCAQTSRRAHPDFCAIHLSGAHETFAKVLLSRYIRRLCACAHIRTQKQRRGHWHWPLSRSATTGHASNAHKGFSIHTHTHRYFMRLSHADIRTNTSC